MRFSKQCSGLNPEEMSFTAAMEGPFKSVGFRWYVLATYDGSLPAGCDPKKLLVTIGALMSRTGEIIALSPDAGIGSTRLPIVNDGGGANLASPAPDPADAWWLHFRAGEDP